jgi:two-component system sensor histidine kinase RpfC
LMDVNMPVMNGIEATKLYRFSALGRKYVPIVSFTADATEEAGRRCKEAGMDACLVKPIEPNHLIATIEALVDGAKGSEPSNEARNVVNYDSARSSKRGRNLPAVDESMLRRLEDLGGKQFVDELATEFIDDVDEMIEKLKVIAASGDVMAFREQLHALRSAAANLGARGIYELCLQWRLIASEDLAERGEAHLRELGREVERVRAKLQTRLMVSDAAV